MDFNSETFIQKEVKARTYIEQVTVSVIVMEANCLQTLKFRYDINFFTLSVENKGANAILRCHNTNLEHTNVQ